MKTLFFFLLLCIIAVIVLCWVYKADIASKIISDASGLDIRIEKLDLSPSGLTAKNITVVEPLLDTTLSVRHMSVETNLWHIFNDVVIINSIHLQEVDLVSKIAKIKIDDVDKIINFAKSFLNSTKKVQTSKQQEGQKYVVKSLEATDVHLSIHHPLQNGQALVINVPQIKINNLNQGKPLTLQEIVDFFVNRALSVKKKG